MSNYAKVAASAVLFLLIAGLSLVQAQNRNNKLNQFFSALTENRQFSGAVLIAERGKIVYENSFGYADFPQKIRNDKNTLFPIASPLSRNCSPRPLFSNWLKRENCKLTIR